MKVECFKWSHGPAICRGWAERRSMQRKLRMFWEMESASTTWVYGNVFGFVFWRVCLEVDGNAQIVKALDMGGRKYNFRISFFLLTGRAEAVGTYLVEKEFSYEWFCFSQWSMEQDCQPRLRGQEWSGVRMGYYERYFGGYYIKISVESNACDVLRYFVFICFTML